MVLFPGIKLIIASLCVRYCVFIYPLSTSVLAMSRVYANSYITHDVEIFSVAIWPKYKETLLDCCFVVT